MEPYAFVGDLEEQPVQRWEKSVANVRQITSTHFLSLFGCAVKLQNDGLQHHMLR